MAQPKVSGSSHPLPLVGCPVDQMRNGAAERQGVRYCIEVCSTCACRMGRAAGRPGQHPAASGSSTFRVSTLEYEGKVVPASKPIIVASPGFRGGRGLNKQTNKLLGFQSASELYRLRGSH
jgi:hypothetical protein